jgi:GrpB-like predicted nucleotidyltransferase (UPF0157 family)
MAIDHSLLLKYDTTNPGKFNAVNTFLLERIPFDLKIEHIGSTSVPGLGGKK